jgi:hypothetical protein
MQRTKHTPTDPAELLARYRAALRKPQMLTPAEVCSELKPFQAAVHTINLGHGTLDEWKKAIRACNLIEYALDHSGIEAEGMRLCLLHAIEVAGACSVRMQESSTAQTGLKSSERACLNDLLAFLEAVFEFWTDHQLAVAAAFCDNAEFTLRQKGHGIRFAPKSVK